MLQRLEYQLFPSVNRKRPMSTAHDSDLFRDELVSTPYTVDRGGCVLPLEAPGLGVEVNETFLIKHPVIEEPSYV